MDLESVVWTPRLFTIRVSNQFDRSNFVREGLVLLDFDGTNVGNIDEFLVQADLDFPHKSLLSCHGNISAFIDWFYDELATLGEEGAKAVLVVWHHADKILSKRAQEDLLFLVSIMQDVEDKVKRARVRLRVVLLREDEAV